MKQIIIILTALLLVSYTQGQGDVNYKVSILDAPVMDIVWCGSSQNDDYDVLLLTNKGSLYRSGDRGDNWEKQTDIINKIAVQQLQDSTRKIGVVNRMLRSPVNHYLVIFLGSEGINWISEDCGETYKALATDRNFREFIFHPYEKDWILASSWSVCPKQQENKPCHITKELYASNDLGKRWDKLTNYIVQFNWGMRSANNSDNIPKSRIIWSQELNAKGHQKISGWNQKTHLYYSDDFLKTRKMMVSSGNKFLLSENYLFVAQVSSTSDQNVNLLVANPNSYEYEFKFTEVEEDLNQHSFTILDNSQGQVFLNINHMKGNSPLGTIYISDSTGTRFSKSLIDNIRDTSDGQCDFEKVQGLDGIYISNVYDSDKAKALKDIVLGRNEQIQVEKQASKTSNDKHKVLNNGDSEQEALENLESYKKTKISFDKGAIWKNLSPPTKDYKGNKITCDANKDCSLNLHSVSSKMKFGPFYSTESAIGIIMGTGNVGKFLANRADQVNTYLSRDGGFTWFEVRKGSHIYEIGDHGALIVAATDQEATNKIVFSADEGLTWKDQKFGEQSIEISNIITEPSNTASRFIAYGETIIEQNQNQYQQGVVVTLDFSQYFQSQCVGAETPDKDDSDYELWTPNGKISPNCLLGKKVTYARRKRDAQCFNGEQFDRKINVEVCECTEENWECDLGFSRLADGPCELGSGKEIDYSPPEQCNGFYLVSQGYRKVAGDVCQGGVDHHPIKLPCPMFGIMSSNNLYNFFIIVGGILIIYILYQKQEEIIQAITSLLSKKQSNKKSGGQAKQGKGNQKDSKAGYVDFSKMDFEKNEGGQFDSSLIEPEEDQQKKDKSNEKSTDPSQSQNVQQVHNENIQFNPRN